MDPEDIEFVAERKQLFHSACLSAIDCLSDSTGTAVSQGDHIKTYSDGREVKVYWPRQFRQLRKVRDISDQEIISELGETLFAPENKQDKPRYCLFSKKRRLVVQIISVDELTVMKTIVGRYVDYMNTNNKSNIMQIYAIMRVFIGSGRRRSSFIRNQADYCYVMLTHSIYPRAKHEVLHVFALDGTKNSTIAHEFGCSPEDSFSLDHELALSPKDRKAVLEQVDKDLKLLQSINLHHYYVLYAITVRGKEARLELPGAPYGPELDVDIPFERRDTLPSRHDVAYGINASAAQLIPTPHQNYEIPEREYYFTFVNILQCDHIKERSKSVYSFIDGQRTTGIPLEECGDSAVAEKFRVTFYNFLQNKLMPNYSLCDDDSAGSAFSEFEDP